MVRADLQPVSVSHLNVTLEGGVNAVTALGSFQIDIGHIGIVAYRLPEHVALIMTHIYAVYMRARVLALDIRVDGGCLQLFWSTTNAVADLFLCPRVYIK